MSFHVHLVTNIHSHSIFINSIIIHKLRLICLLYLFRYQVYISCIYSLSILRERILVHHLFNIEIVVAKEEVNIRNISEIITYRFCSFDIWAKTVLRIIYFPSLLSFFSFCTDTCSQSSRKYLSNRSKYVHTRTDFHLLIDKYKSLSCLVWHGKSC